jgi:hypothetical protein
MALDRLNGRVFLNCVNPRIRPSTATRQTAPDVQTTVRYQTGWLSRSAEK